MNIIILTNPVTLVLSVFALILTVAVRFVARKIGNGLSILSFISVLACITYALLLGAELIEILIFLLVFVLIGIISFLPDASSRLIDENINENSTEEDDNSDNTSDKNRNNGTVENKEEEKK